MCKHFMEHLESKTTISEEGQFVLELGATVFKCTYAMLDQHVGKIDTIDQLFAHTPHKFKALVHILSEFVLIGGIRCELCLASRASSASTTQEALIVARPKALDPTTMGRRASRTTSRA